MVPFSDVLEAITLLAGYTFIPMLFVISVALFINLVLRYRHRVIDSDEESAVEPSRRYLLESRRIQRSSHGVSQTEEACVTEPRILQQPFQCIEDQAENFDQV